MKTLTGGALVYSRGLYSPPGEPWKPQFLLWIAGNSFPQLQFEEVALWNRIVVIKPHPVPAKKRQSDLLQ